MALNKVGGSAGLFVVLLLGCSTGAWGEMQEYLNKIHFNTSLQGMYDSNIDQTQENPRSDFITTISAGIKYADKGPAYNLDLGFDVGLNFYASYLENNYVSTSGHLKTYYDLTPHWTVRLYETLTYSRENLQSYSYPTATGDQTVTSSSTGNGPYFRNIFQPSVDYKFGRENVASLLFRNMVYLPQGSDTSQEGMENNISPSLTYWFSIRHGVSLDYTYTKADYKEEPNQLNQSNWAGSNLGGRYLYRFNPLTTAFGEYRYLIRNFDFSRYDYSVNSPSVGITHTFNPTLTGSAQFGWFWQQVEVGSPLSGPVYILSVTQRVQRTSFNLIFSGGYREQYFISDNQGFSKYNQAQLSVNHQLRERLSVGLTGTLSQDDYQIPAHVDWNWGLTASLAYQPLKWLTVYLAAGNNGRSSDLNGDSYRDNQITLRLTAEY
jgi:hypothetical protein